MEVRHVAVVLRVRRILASRVVLVDLALQFRVPIGVRHEEEEQTRYRARRRVRPCDDGENAVVN